MVSVTYDAEHDILHADWTEPVAAFSKDIGGGRFVRVTPEGEVVGITIWGFVEGLRAELTAGRGPMNLQGRPMGVFA